MSVTLIVGDVHLGASLSVGKPGIGTALNSRIIDQSSLLDWIYETAINKLADAIIFTGDICEDSKPDYILLDIFIKFLKRCEIANIQIHIVAGNHDIKRAGNYYTSFLDLISSAEIHNTFIYKHVNTIYRAGACFTLFPYRDRRAFNCDSNVKAVEILADKLTYESAEMPVGWDRVLVGHLALEGSLPVGNEIDDLTNELMCPFKMFQDYDYVWMGHIHKPQVLSTKPYLAHVGSLDISDFGETEHTKIIIVFDTENPSKFIEIPVPSRPWRKISITVPNNTTDSTAFVVEEVSKIHQKLNLNAALLKIEIKLDGIDVKNVNRSEIEEAIYELGAFHISNFSEQRRVSVTPLNKQDDIDNTVTPKTAVKLYSEQLKFDSEEDKQNFIAYSNLVIEKFTLQRSK